ncbi:MAG: retropepsin-like aspartic protease [Terracidiphilus sp.]|nr:retropepsin-like aspartic protease [Terracidiphilus sp.]
MAAVLLGTAASVCAQAPVCPAVAQRTATPADVAYGDSRYADAESFYEQALTQSPRDADLSAALVHTLLHEGKVAEALAQANAALAGNPHAAASLAALAEVQLRQGQPWLAVETLDAAQAANPCSARTHLIRSRALRIDSMYASERAELQRAYDIDPADPDIQQAWLRIVSPAHEIVGIDQGLAAAKDIDAETRKKAEASMHSMMPLLSEYSQTCQVLPELPSATLPLQPTFADVKHIDGYRLEAEFQKTKAKLIVDTAASGLYITRTLAEQNGFHQGKDDPPGTVRADSVRIGPLEFRDCIVGVSDTPFAGHADGFIGTDIFSPWLITLDYRLAKLTLAPLPQQAALLPADRPATAELAGFTPVYHRRQYLLVPLTFGNRSRKLFILATGMRFSAMTEDAAHSLSKMTVNFTNAEQTAQGTKVNFYREIFDMQVGNLPEIHQGHILELDPSIIDRNAGFQIAGMLGLDVLQPLTLRLDYRDGLVKFESAQAETSPAFSKGAMIASASAPAPNVADQSACPPGDTTDRPINQTIEARVTGGLDSGHLKPGKEVWVKVVNGYIFPGCTLEADSILYGHVTSSTSSKNPNASELSVLFDHGDCTGHGKKQLSLRLVGLLAPPAEASRHLHEELPTEVAGGARSIQTAVAGLVDEYDSDLNPGGPPHTVHPGIVVHMPDVKLEPEGGPGCSARITSTNHSVQLGAGSELILTMSTPR